MSEIARTTFLLEVGVEEIPARMASPAAADLCRLLAADLEGARLASEGLARFVTPRRLVVLAHGMPVRQEHRTVEKRGPSRRIAFDAEGNPTRAGQGFARSQGLEVSQLETIVHNEEEYVLARTEEAGAETIRLLPEILVKALSSLRFPKSMRWGRTRQSFVRPVHWLLALLGDEIVEFEFAGIQSGRHTRGHRFMGAAGDLEVANPNEYSRLLSKNHVMLAPEERKRRIREGTERAARDLGLTVVMDEGLLDEVTHLVESPVVDQGTFSARYLEMPEEVLVTSMKNHQKFFATRKQGRLSNHFLVVNNTEALDRKAVVRGNERVLTARLEDALFFFNEDHKTPLKDYVESLAGQTFLAGLGSMEEKSRRLEKLASAIALKLHPEAEVHARRAALLCKADLATEVVGEFPELQGIMGREYGRAGGEPEAVAVAIYEHYLPRFAGDELPATWPGIVLALADRADTVVGCFHLGLLPTATKDPYGLRRAALACVRILAEHEVTVPLDALVRLTIDGYGDTITGDKEELLARIMEFARGRLRNWLAGDHATEVVDACLAAGCEVPWDVREKSRAVESLRGREDYEDLIQPFKRVINITRKEKVGGFDRNALVEPAEKDLWQDFLEVRTEADALFDQRRFGDLLQLLLKLKPSIDRYFDDVLVMCEDQVRRGNRLAMLAEIGRLFLRFADFTRILA